MSKLVELALPPSIPGQTLSLRAIDGSGSTIPADLDEQSNQPGRYLATFDAEDVPAGEYWFWVSGDLDNGRITIGTGDGPFFRSVPSTIEQFSDTAEAQLTEIVNTSVAAVRGSLSSPAMQRGTLLVLTAGDDRLASISRQIPWTLENASSLPDFSSGWTVRARLYNRDRSAFVDFTSGTISVGNGATRSGYLEAASAVTDLLAIGDGTYQLAFVKTSGNLVITPLEGRTHINPPSA